MRFEDEHHVRPDILSTPDLAATLDAKRALTPDLAHPIFIGGSGRSGTGAVFHWVREQPTCFPIVRGEAKFIVETDGLVDLRCALVESYSPIRAWTALRRFRALMLETLSGPDLYGAGNAAIAKTIDPVAYEALVVGFCESLLSGTTPALHSAEAFAAKARALLDAFALLSCAKTAAAPVEKTPHNLLHAGFLRALYPEARFIHVVRDPRDVATSIVRQPWGPDTIESACLWLNEYFAAYRRARDAADIPEGALLEIRVEDLADESSPAYADLAAFIGLDAPPDARPTDPGSELYPWRRGEDRNAMRRASTLLADIIAAYGYEPS